MFALGQPKHHPCSIISTIMVIVSIILLPLQDSSGSKVDDLSQQEYSNSHAQIQYPSSTQSSKGNYFCIFYSFVVFQIMLAEVSLVVYICINIM